METQLRFYEKNVFGNDLIYPAPEFAQAFSMLTGRKTAGESEMIGLEKLGFTIVINKANYETVYR